MNTKAVIKKIVPKAVLNLRHLFFAWYGAVKYKHPSKELLVIGITGTSGKSSTVCFLRQLLEHAGFVVGSLSTIDFYVAGENKLNDKKMTMLGLFANQKYLREMVDKKCDIAIVETTSEGAVQHRHKFINYDMMMLTNLYPEHIDSHGSFEKYKQAKKDIFSYVSRQKRKTVQNKKLETLHMPLVKTAIVNANSEYAEEFLSEAFEEKRLFSYADETVSLSKHELSGTCDHVSVEKTHVTKKGLAFEIDKKTYTAPMYGKHNIGNIAAAISVMRALHVDDAVLQDAVKNLESPAGRVESIPEAAAHGFQVIVDYAFEPGAMAGLYTVVDVLKPKRVIHVFGSTGGGRDIERRFTVGKFIAERADICIITDEDPYDDNPMDIINDVASAVEKTGKQKGKNLFEILDRSKAIQKAVNLAQAGDLILVTGKGSEQAIVVKGELVSWDDRVEVRKALLNK
jgi:UDP-N-acetylmuramoyl-L-alanyl-D-glutamate--2,6-diaminopimelate ligase